MVSSQLTFDIEPKGKRKLTLRERFAEYVEANPHVYELFVAMALKAKSAGYKRYGAWPIVNIMRWNTGVEANDPNSEYKICNDYIALLSRKAEADNPELKDFFTKKPMKR